MFLQLGAPGGVSDFLAMAAARGIGAHGSGPESVFFYAFTRGGRFREALVIEAGASFETNIIEPEAQRCVSLMAAMPWNLGDGAVLRVSLDNGGRLTEVVRLPLDPAHIRAHRAWVPVRFGIPAEAKAVRLRFEVDPGSRNDSTADWLGLAAGDEAGCLFAQRTS
jgi:hypothetical protein